MADRSGTNKEFIQEVCRGGSTIRDKTYIVGGCDLLDSVHMQDLTQISETVTRDNIGDAMLRAIVVKAAIVNPDSLVVSDRILEKIGDFARGADIGWKIFKRGRFIQSHWDLYDRLILLRLRLLSVLTALDVNFAEYPPQKIFHIK